MRPRVRSRWRLLRLGLALLVVMTGGLLLPAPALAATITVTTTADTFAPDGQCSLREAILTTNANAKLWPGVGECPAGSALGLDTIVLSNVTYSLSSSVPDAIVGATGLPTVTGALAIRSSGATIQRASGTFRILRVAPGASLTLNSVTIRNGLAEVKNERAWGAGIYNEGTLTLFNGSSVRNNLLVMNVNSTSAKGYGGGIYSTGSLTITNGTLSGNAVSVTNDGTGADAYGGGIYSTGSLTITNSTLSSNAATATNDGTGADAYGGGIYNTGGLTITNSTLSGNAVTATNTGTSADASGGGIDNSGTLTLTGSALSDNTVTATNTGTSADAYGGGLANRQSAAGTVTATDISGNRAEASISGTVSSARGGGISFWSTGALVVTTSTLRGNTASGRDISGNDGSGSGGGISVYDGMLILTNSTVSGNTATGMSGRGGGLDLGYQGSAVLTHVTIADNEALTDGGGLASTSTGTLNLTGTIVAGNRTGGLTGQPTADCRPITSGAAVGSANLVGTATGCPVLPNHREVSAAGVFTTVLEPLASNGGATQTHALKLAAGNLAVDRGDNAICAGAAVQNIDQRGETRPFDGEANGTATCDIGAYELRTALPTLSLTTSASVAPASVSVGGTTTITATVTSSLTQTFLVDVEVYSAAGTKVYQQWFDSEPFTANVARQFVVNWTVPAGTAPGQYTVRLGVFIPGWGVLYAWNDSAATITVT